HIKICDFGEAFLWRDEPQPIELHTPSAHAAPEILFHDPVSPAVDVWSTAVLAHCLLSRVYPFNPDGAGSVVYELVLNLGKLPDRWWAKWSDRSKWFDENDVYIGQEDLKRMVEGKSQCFRITRWMKGPQDEIVKFENLVRRMLCYRVEDWISADGVIQS
ncbi:kinase-like domain-containing protein, partial [Hygrophoropsis aurantiaca]